MEDFLKTGLEYTIKLEKDNKLPTVWSMVLANKTFGTIVTQNLGGYTWHRNSRLNRLSSWNNNPAFDLPSEIIYLKDYKTGRKWSLCNNLNNENLESYITYGFGYVKFKTVQNNIMQELDIFVPTEDNVKINILKLKNLEPNKRNIKLVYYIKPVLGEDEIKTNGYIEINKENNIIIAKNLYKDSFKNDVAFVSTSEPIKSYTASKDFFIGNGNLENPEGLDKVELDNSTGLGQNSCIAIELEIELESYENKEIVLQFGEESTILDVKNTAYKYSKISNCMQELSAVKSFWYDLVNKVQVNTPLESLNLMINGWAKYQTIVSRLWARSGYYQSGGAIGFRDQLQDTIGLKYVDIGFMKEQILIACRHQFIEGDVEHWWHEDTNRGIRTRFSDDLLWLCYVVYEYINYTGDYSILDKEEPYVMGELLPDGVDERYDVYLESQLKEDVYTHCIRAIDKSLNFGEHGLPKIGSGDWNDGLNTVGNKQKGESIWLGFFIYDILGKFIEICEKRNDVSRVNEYKEKMDSLKKALNTAGWDGRWFRRAYMDNGEPLGSIENEECRIDSISQSWGVISGAADNDKKYISMEALENHLIDIENGIIKLLDPPFNKTKLEPGYIKAYLPGVRENGGQYTHAAMWAIIAYSKLGFGDKAVEYYRMVNPIEHSRTKEAARKYKVEPYVIAADIYGASNLQGRGGWTWYTGSSSWFCKAGLEDILGLKVEKGILKIEPCISSKWEEYSIRYRYKTSVYNIQVRNPNGKCIRK